MKKRVDEGADADDVIEQEARIWLRRLISDKVTQWDVQAFQRWRQHSDAHRAAFDEAKRQWQQMKPAIGLLLRTDAAAAAAHQRTLNRPNINRRAFLGLAASAAVGGIAVAYAPGGLWPAADEWRADYRTATGEQRTLVLSQQVEVIMNTRTSMRRQESHGRVVGMELLSGEAAVELNHADQAFSLAAGQGRCLSNSGQFNIRYLNDRVGVTCLQGSLQVEHPAGTRTLQANQQMVYNARMLSEEYPADPAGISAWRKGELVFKQTPLYSVLAEIDRYRPGHIVLMASSVRDSPLSGRFTLANLDAALLQIQRSFNLQARSLPGGLLILS